MSEPTYTWWEDQPLPLPMPQGQPRSVRQIVEDRDGGNCRICWKQAGEDSKMIKLRESGTSSDRPELIIAKACNGCAQRVSTARSNRSLHEGSSAGLVWGDRVIFRLLAGIYWENCSMESLEALEVSHA